MNSVSTDASAALSTGAASSIWQRFAAAIETAGEWLNPLLVKEVRQSLKSRQFMFTFALVLCLSWFWSIAGITRLGADVSYGANGPELFYGYYLILAFPLLLIVPYSAYRSLIAEREDNTYELVAITALKPRQIVGGKLGSAVAQMLVYASAVTPCLAFTYLLRGIDVITIGWILFYTFLASLGFSLCALMFATAAKEKQWQIAYSVVIIVGLFTAFSHAVAWCHELLESRRLPFDNIDFWIANLAFLSFYWSTFALLYLGAGAQLTFTADNRSTPLRIAMLVQQVLFAGWLSYYLIHDELHRQSLWQESIKVATVAYTVVSLAYWYLMGGFLLGEATELSARVKRSLPKTFLGRMFFTWFNPGPGTGYLFAVSNAIAAVLLAILVVVATLLSHGAFSVGRTTFTSDLISFLILVLGYFVVYLGVANLLLRLLRLVTNVTLSSATLINILLLLAGWGLPKVIHEAMQPQVTGYTMLHVTDPFWSCYIAAESPNIADDLLWRVLPAAAAVLILNLVYIIPEIRQVRIVPPPRVKEEDSELAATHVPPPLPSNPWE